jgi:photosystem II stability/assembly factor-like uncharacterized protein
MKVPALALLLLVPSLAAERWNIQYHYDEDKSSLELNDLVFASPLRGIAVGALTEGDNSRGASLITRDGGKSWHVMRQKEAGSTLHFVNENVGWMVTGRGLWQTEDGGETWRKRNAPRHLYRVHFLTPERGFAAGAMKGLYETRDGGKTWKPMAVADTVKTRPQNTHFTTFAFINDKEGMIVGYSRPPRRSDEGLPSWVDPEKAEVRKEQPALTILIKTSDGGETWTADSMSLFGRITRIRARPTGQAVGLVEFTDSFDYSSEVFAIDWRSGKGERIFRGKERAITDIALAPDGPVYLGGFEAPGKLQRLPVPGKVKILESSDSKQWREMDVDYRAVCRRLTFASADGSLWAATDTGMILRLDRRP